MLNLRNNNRITSRGFLLLMVMGLLSLLLVLCVGFLVAVRAQTQSVMTQRNRTDLINIAHSGLDWASAQIATRIFAGDTVDPAKYVSAAYNNLPWYKELCVNATKAGGISQQYDWTDTGRGAPFDSKRETTWVYLPKDYLLEGGLRARMAVQIVDTNAYTAVNDGLEDASPSHAQQAHLLQSAIGWTGFESRKARNMDIQAYRTNITYGDLGPRPTGGGLNSKRVVGNSYGNAPLRYNEIWSLASHSLRSVGDNYLWYPGVNNPGTPAAASDERQQYRVAANRLTQNTIFWNADAVENCLAQTQLTLTTYSVPFISCRSYTDPDTGRTPINVNTCPNSGEVVVGGDFNGNLGKPPSVLEGVFNIGALRRIIKVGSFFANANTNAGVVPGIRYLDPYLYYVHGVGGGTLAKSPFLFDPTTRLVRLVDASGTEVFRNTNTGEAPVGSTAMRNPAAEVTFNPDPATIGTLDPVTNSLTQVPGRAGVSGPPRDPSTVGTVDPLTVSIDPVAGKMMYAITTNPSSPSASLPVGAPDATHVGLAADITAAYTANPGSAGRAYSYKSYEDLYAMLNTEERVQVEKLKTKLAVQYQETLTRYFLASSYNRGATAGGVAITDHPRYPNYDKTMVGMWNCRYKHCYKNYYNTYLGVLGAAEAGKVKYYAENFNYSAPRFPYSPESFRTKVRDDLIAMTVNNNAVYAGWVYNTTVVPKALRQSDYDTSPSGIKDAGEYVNFDDTGKSEVCQGKLDKRTASAIFDNICPGKRYLFPTEPNMEIRNPLTQLYKRRVGIDENAINWMYKTPEPTAPSEPFWKPKPLSGTPTETTLAVNSKRMNDPYNYFLYKEDRNENSEDTNDNGVLDLAEDTNGNGVLDGLDPGEDLIKSEYISADSSGNVTSGAAFIMDPDTGDALNPVTKPTNLKLDKFDTTAHIDAARERGEEVWSADPNSPIKGRDYLTTATAAVTTTVTRFIDENIYFSTALDPVSKASADFDQNKANCFITPLPTDISNAGTWAKVLKRDVADSSLLYVKDSNGFLSPVKAPVNIHSNFNGGKFDTIEYIPGHAKLDPAIDLNNDGTINAYYHTPERQLAFGNDHFSQELTTTSVSYRVVVTVELCDSGSVDRNPAAPLVVTHSEINAVVQLAPDIEGSALKEAASDYIDPVTGATDKSNDPGLHYYRTNQPTIRKTRTYDESSGDIITYNSKTGVAETYDAVKEAKGLQIRGGIMDEQCPGVVNNVEKTSSARQWIDPLGIPDAKRDAYYQDPHQTKRRIVVKDLINLGSSY